MALYVSIVLLAALASIGESEEAGHVEMLGLAEELRRDRDRAQAEQEHECGDLE